MYYFAGISSFNNWSLIYRKATISVSVTLLHHDFGSETIAFIKVNY